MCEREREGERERERHFAMIYWFARIISTDCTIHHHVTEVHIKVVKGMHFQAQTVERL